MAAAKKQERQYLDIVKGWMTYENEYSCVGRAVYVQEKGRSWSSWHSYSSARSGEEWKFEYALEVHGKAPDKKNVPPKRVPIERFRKQYAAAQCIDDRDTSQ